MLGIAKIKFKHLNSSLYDISQMHKRYILKDLRSANIKKNNFEKFMTINKKYLLIAKNKKTIHHWGITAMKKVEIFHGNKYGDGIRKIPLLNDTAANRITEIINDQFEQLITILK